MFETPDNEAGLGAAISGTDSSAKNETALRHREREREFRMTVGERIDANISKLTGEVERLQGIRKRLGSAADIKAHDLTSSIYHEIGNIDRNPF